MKRISVVVSDEQHQVLRDLAQLQGRSAASYVREMLDAATPMLVEVLEVWRVAGQAQEAQPEGLRLAAAKQALAALGADVEQLSDLLRPFRDAPAGTPPAGDGDA